MGVRHAHNRAKEEIMGQDFDSVVKRAKARYRTDKRFRSGIGFDEFYIILVADYYFASSSIVGLQDKNCIVSHFTINDETKTWREEKYK